MKKRMKTIGCIALTLLMSVILGCAVEAKALPRISSFLQPVASFRGNVDLTSPTPYKNIKPFNIPTRIVLPPLEEYKMVLILPQNPWEEDNEIEEIQYALAEKGISSLVLNFSGNGRSTEEKKYATLENAISDAKNCLKYMKNTYSIDTSKIGVIGIGSGSDVAYSLAKEEGIEKIYLLHPLTKPSDDVVSMQSYEETKILLEDIEREIQK